MSSVPMAILVRDLNKTYRIYKTPLDAFREALTRKSRHIPRVALNHINLEVRRGEIIGVMGRNGAGKSTLLKIIAGTLEKTSGDLSVNGRITAILELGSGFHPDYTGRENIYMGGMCLGMSKKEVNAKLESIIEFSELREVIDQPFKTYSTGMQARLTFSVAISVDPDILIVDEALSVGDARFQLKCFTRLHQLREKSTTILLVSHDINTITTLCDRALILESGGIYAEGDAKLMSTVYHNLLFGSSQSEAQKTPFSKTISHENDSIGLEDSSFTASAKIQHPESALTKPIDVALSKPSMRYGSREARVIDWGFLDEKSQRCSVIESGRRCRIYMVADCAKDVDDMTFGMHITDRRGTVLWGVTNVIQFQRPYQAKAGTRVSASADCVMWLTAGDYFITLGLAHLNDNTKIDFLEDAVSFKVIGPGGIYTTSTVNLQTIFRVEEKPAVSGMVTKL